LQKDSPSTLYINFGESFVEVAIPQQETFLFKRYFLPKNPLKKIIQEFPKTDQIVICSQLPLTIINRKIGAAPAYLTTQGFENWLDMSTPTKEDFFTINMSKPITPLNSHLVFGINERVLANGEIEKKIDLSELEFLNSKLQLNNIKTIAINFLHSLKNSENEKVATDFFRNHGYTVFSSHENNNPSSLINFSEKRRWWYSILNAYAYPTWFEEMEQLEELFQSQNIEKKIVLKVINNFGEITPWRTSTPLETAFAKEHLISQFFRKKNVNGKHLLGCYMGLEKFQIFNTADSNSHIWKSEYGPVSLNHTSFTNFYIQPTSQVTAGFWNAPTIHQESSGYEPGPMCFGKSVKATFMDALYLENLLDKIDGLAENLVEKTKNRIKDTFFTYSKNSFGPEIILKLGAQSLAGEILKYPQNHVYIAGPFAPTLSFILNNTKVDKVFTTYSESYPILSSMIGENLK
jgi:hypothetical protein